MTNYVYYSNETGVEVKNIGLFDWKSRNIYGLIWGNGVFYI